jgi:hypothetical protein
MDLLERDVKLNDAVTIVKVNYLLGGKVMDGVRFASGVILKTITHLMQNEQKKRDFAAAAAAFCVTLNTAIDESLWRSKQELVDVIEKAIDSILPTGGSISEYTDQFKYFGYDFLKTQTPEGGSSAASGGYGVSGGSSSSSSNAASGG